MRLYSEDCIALPNSSKIDAVIDLDKEAVVQDYNSQRVGEFIKLAIGARQESIGRNRKLMFGIVVPLVAENP